MNWDAIGAVGQIIGALAVVVTLGYLAVQIRIVRSGAADTSRLTRTIGVHEAMLSTISNDALIESLMSVLGRGYYEEFGGQFAISAREAARVDFFNLHWFWLHWGQFASSNTTEDLSELSRHIQIFYSLPAVAYSWWKSPFGRTLLDQRFVKFVDGLLSKAA